MKACLGTARAGSENKGVPGGLTIRPGTLAGSKTNRIPMVVSRLHSLVIEDDVSEAWLRVADKNEQKNTVFECFETSLLTFHWQYVSMLLIGIYLHLHDCLVLSHHPACHFACHIVCCFILIRKEFKWIKCISGVQKEYLQMLDRITHLLPPTFDLSTCR